VKDAINRDIKRFMCLLFLITVLFNNTAHSSNPDSQSSLSIRDVSVSRDSFNPSSGEKVEIRFNLSEKARVTLKLYDFDGDMVASICEEKEMEKGAHLILWDGRDQSGGIVPDEAYFFTIEAKQGNDSAIYDPTAFSGGITHEIEMIKVSPEQNQIEYSLPEQGRVSIKAGIVNGPLLAIPVDWEPRTKGLHHEYWDGMDQNRLFSVLDNPRYQLRASYFTLPENTIITKGNKSITYSQYKLNQKVNEPKKTITIKRKSILSAPLYTSGVLFSRAPVIEVIFPDAQLTENRIPVFKGKMPLKIDLSEDSKPFLSHKQYEIYFFINHAFLTEDPQIKLPYETVLEVEGYTIGSYILSVNVIGPGGQVGIKNKKILLQ